MAALFFEICIVVLIVTVDSSKSSRKMNNTQMINSSMQHLNFGRVQLRAEAFYLMLPETLKEDAILTTPELIRKYGYPAETHKITTEDGYILKIHRIPRGIKLRSGKRPVVLLQHGLLSSSADWIFTGPRNGLGYILANAGFDVWMGNSRGNRYSRNHNRLDPDSAEFWQFSWHEIGIYDLPATIDYILAETKQEKLYYIGHSQGTTTFYVLCSQNPEYNNKIHIQFSLAPIAYMTHVTSPLIRLLARFSGTETLAGLIGINEFNPTPEWLQAQQANFFCNDESVTQILCTNIYFILMGYNVKQMNASLLPILMGQTPAGASIKQLIHYGQEIHSGRFEYFDNGLANLLEYGLVSPPQYDLGNVKAPVYLLYSRNDWMSHEIDVLRLCRELGNCKGKILIADAEFNHGDYLYAIDAPDLVYKKLLALATQHRK